MIQLHRKGEDLDSFCLRPLCKVCFFLFFFRDWLPWLAAVGRCEVHPGSWAVQPQASSAYIHGVALPLSVCRSRGDFPLLVVNLKPGRKCTIVTKNLCTDSRGLPITSLPCAPPSGTILAFHFHPQFGSLIPVQYSTNCSMCHASCLAGLRPLSGSGPQWASVRITPSVLFCLCFKPTTVLSSESGFPFSLLDAARVAKKVWNDTVHTRLRHEDLAAPK